uniref:Uncharacterized protein n=1 Tax=Oryza meridionalis TaxID=40149 RepID=A0A0E0DGL7_9ORYZ
MPDGLPDDDQLLVDGLLRKARALLLNMTISMEHLALTRLAAHARLVRLRPFHRHVPGVDLGDVVRCSDLYSRQP